jgi:hypothetical protein
VAYPTGLDSIPQPGAGSLTNNPSHAGTHVLEITAIQALEAKSGIGASTPVASTLLRGTGTGTSAWAQAVLTTDVTGTLPVANGGTGVTSSTGSGNVVLSTSPALTTPTGIVKGDVGLGNVDNTSDATKNAATVALTNKTITSNTNSVSAVTLTNPYKFNVYLGTAQSAGTATWNKILLNTKNFDTSTNFDNTTNYRFTAPIAGFYFLQGQVQLTQAGAGVSTIIQSALYKNGSPFVFASIVHMAGDGTMIPNNVITGLFQLAASDYIELYGYIQDPGRVYGNGPAETFMSGFLVSTT